MERKRQEDLALANQLAEAVDAAGGVLKLTASELRRRFGYERSWLDDGRVRRGFERRLGQIGVEVEYLPRRSIRLSLAEPARHEGPLTLPMWPQSPHDEPLPHDRPLAHGEPVADSKRLWSGFFAVASLLAAFFPAIGYELVPGGRLEDETTTFFIVYLSALPLCVATTALVLLEERGASVIPNGRDRALLACAIIVASGVCGLGIGVSQEEQNAFAHVGGPWYFKLFVAASYVAMSYLVYYGPILFGAGIVAGVVAGLWINEQLGPTGS